MSREKGSLIWLSAGKTWAGRYWTTTDGVRWRPQVNLHTNNKAIARRKLAQLIAGETPVEKQSATESFIEAALRIVERQGVDGNKSWKARLALLKRYAFPEFGQLQVTDVRPEHIRLALTAAMKAGKSKTTLTHLRVSCSVVFGEFEADGVILANPARGKVVKIPKAAKHDLRPFAVLTDSEYNQFMASPRVPLSLHVRAASSRELGGMRASDLHAWEWNHIDTVGWETALVLRPKTGDQDRHVIPETLVPLLQTWWHEQGRPRSGPVFGYVVGDRAGQRRAIGTYYARWLRDALWRAGVVRKLPGFDEAKNDVERRKLCELQSGSAQFRRVNFHSFRRAFATAVNRATQNTIQSMRLASHKQVSTHMRYVGREAVLEAPAAAIPRLVRDFSQETPRPDVVDIAGDDRQRHGAPNQLKRRQTELHVDHTQSSTRQSAPLVSKRAVPNSYGPVIRYTDDGGTLVTSEAILGGIALDEPWVAEALIQLEKRASALALKVCGGLEVEQ